MIVTSAEIDGVIAGKVGRRAVADHRIEEEIVLVVVAVECPVEAKEEVFNRQRIGAFGAGGNKKSTTAKFVVRSKACCPSKLTVTPVIVPPVSDTSLPLVS